MRTRRRGQQDTSDKGLQYQKSDSTAEDGDVRHKVRRVETKQKIGEDDSK